MKYSPSCCADVVETLRSSDICAFVECELSIGEVPDLVDVGVGRAQHRRDHHARDSGAEVVDEVEPARADLFVEKLPGEAADAVLDAS